MIIQVRRIPAFAVLAALVLATIAAAQSPATESRGSAAAPGPWKVAVLDETWRDDARDRAVPVRLFIPNEAVAPAESRPASRLPVIIVSPGLGGSRATYGYLASHLATHGYLVVAVTHAGSDTRDFAGRIARRMRDGLTGEGGAASRGGNVLLDSVNDADNLRDRPRDVSFVLDRVATHPVLGARADLERVGVAGHSFGAHTAMCLGGMTIDLPEAKGHSFRDPRVKAVLPMSPEGPGAMGIRKGAWAGFAVPVLFLTGTFDYGTSGASAAWRRSGFEGVHGKDDYLVTINGAGHMTFAIPGRGKGGRTAADPEGLIDSLAVSFFDAYVRDDAAARTWLKTFFGEKHADCVAEFKPASATPESR